MTESTSRDPSTLERAEEEFGRILYDLVVHSPEWEQYLTQEALFPFPFNVTLWNSLQSACRRCFTRACGRAAASPLRAHLSSLIPWILATSRDGRSLVLVHDRLLTLRTSNDNFKSSVSEATAIELPGELPRERAAAWDLTGTHFGFLRNLPRGFHLSVFRCLSTTLAPLSDISSEQLQVRERAVNFTFRCANKEDPAGGLEVIVLTESGRLIHLPLPDGRCTTTPTITSMDTQHVSVSSMCYDPVTDIVAIGGMGVEDDAEGGGFKLAPSISVWKVSRVGVKCLHCTTLEEGGLLMRVPWYKKLCGGRTTAAACGVYKMAFSFNGDYLASVDDMTGALTVWSTSSWARHHVVSAQRLCVSRAASKADAHEKDGEDTEDYEAVTLMSEEAIVDVSWWSNAAVVVAHRNGCLTLSSLHHGMRNLLGANPERFESSPRVTAMLNGRFFVLESERAVVPVPTNVWNPITPMELSAISRPKDDEDGAVREEDDEDDDVPPSVCRSMVGRAVLVFRAAMMKITNNEEWADDSWHECHVPRQTHRLISIRRMTPVALFARKVKHGDYGDALALARAYGLNTDPVYQKQWSKATVSKHALQDYMGRIEDKQWVLWECRKRAPETVAQTRLLLEYGLEQSIPSDFAAIRSEVELAADEAEEVIEDEDVEQEISSKIAAYVRSRGLTEEQTTKMFHHLSLRQYLKRLETYALIKGERDFDAEEFLLFRDRDLSEAARAMAEEEDFSGLEALLLRHGEDMLEGKYHTLRDYLLEILASIPETTPPSLYARLLPRMDPHSGLQQPWAQEEEDGAPSLPEWTQSSEMLSYLRAAVLPDGFLDGGPVAKDLACDNVREADGTGVYPLTNEVMKNWCVERARDIDRLSGRVDNSLELVRLAIDNGVGGLLQMHHCLNAMDTVVYECGIDMTLKAFEGMSDGARLHAIMGGATAADAVELFRSNARSFLDSYDETRRVVNMEGQENHDNWTDSSSATLLADYMLSLAKEKLDVCAALIAGSAESVPKDLQIIQDRKTLLRVALECAYQCSSSGKETNTILNSIVCALPHRDPCVAEQDPEYEMLQDRVDLMGCHLLALEKLAEFNMEHSLAFLAEATADTAKELIYKFARQVPVDFHAFNHPPTAHEAWRGLLKAVLEIQENVFASLVSRQYCYERVCEGLLFGRQFSFIHSLIINKRVLGWPEVEQLVLDAAIDLVNSATDPSDSSMLAAKDCLAVVPPRNQSPALIAERDMILGLEQLYGFGCTVVPVQVRLMEDRCDAIKMAVAASGPPYDVEAVKQMGRLLGLKSRAQQVRVACIVAFALLEDASARAEVLRVCEQAMDEEDAAAGAHAWSLCVAAAKVESFPLSFRQRAADFAVTRCAPSELGAVLAVRTNVFEPDMESFQVDLSSIDVPTSPFPRPLVPNDATGDAYAVLVAALAATRLDEDTGGGHKDEILCALALQALHVDENLCTAYLLALEDSLQARAVIERLHAGVSADERGMAQIEGINIFAFRLFCLRALVDCESAPKRCTAVFASTSELLTLLATHVPEGTDSSAAVEARRYSVSIQSNMTARAVVSMMSRLDRDAKTFDMVLFLSGSPEGVQYRSVVARQLARSPLPEALELAVRVATDGWDVTASHVVYLLTEAEVDIKELTNLLDACRDDFLKRPGDATQVLGGCLPNLQPGLRLVEVYFGLLAAAAASCGDDEAARAARKRVMHIQSLHNVAPSLDFAKALACAEDTRACAAVVGKATDASNVGKVAKLVVSMFEGLSASAVYCAYIEESVQRLALSASPQSVVRDGCNTLLAVARRHLVLKDLERAGGSVALLSRLSPNTRISFLKSIVSIVEERAHAVESTDEGSTEKKRKRKGPKERPEETVSAQDIALVVQNLKKALKHVQVVAKLGKTSVFSKEKFLQKYDETGGDRTKVVAVLSGMAAGPHKVAYALLARFVSAISWDDTVEGVYIATIKMLLEGDKSLFGDEEDGGIDFDAKLREVVLAVAGPENTSTASDDKEEAVQAIVEELSAHARNTAVPLHSRIATLQLTELLSAEGGCSMRAADASLVELLQVRSVLGGLRDVTEDSLKSAESRAVLFEEVLRAGVPDVPLELLLLWEDNSEMKTDASLPSLWWRLLMTLADNQAPPETLALLRYNQCSAGMDEEADMNVVEAMLDRDSVHVPLVYGLLSPHVHVRERVVDALVERAPKTVLFCPHKLLPIPRRLPDGVMELCLRAGVLHLLRPSAHYRACLDYVRGARSSVTMSSELAALLAAPRAHLMPAEIACSPVHTVATLASRGLFVEAGALVLSEIGMSGTLRNVDTAASVLMRRYLNAQVLRLGASTREEEMRSQGAEDVVHDWGACARLCETALAALPS